MSVPQASVREQVIEAMLGRAQAILIANGFNTDAGAKLIVGERRALGPDDPASAIRVLIEDDARITWQAGKVFYRIPFVFEAIARVDQVEAWRTVERVMQDVKRAIELPDSLLGRLLEHPGLERLPVKAMEREPGASDVGVQVIYLAPVQESWGNP